jgi:hypothetical protein
MALVEDELGRPLELVRPALLDNAVMCVTVKSPLFFEWVEVLGLSTNQQDGRSAGELLGNQEEGSSPGTAPSRHLIHSQLCTGRADSLS